MLCFSIQLLQIIITLKNTYFELLYMGKKKIDNIKYMEDKNQRNITFSKRKRGLLKKIIELSSLCG